MIEKMYSVAEFYDWVDAHADGRWELLEGQIFAVPKPSPKNAKIVARFARHLRAFVDERDLGHVLGIEGAYTLSPHNVRVPDVSYIAKARLPDLPRRLDIAPDLVVEVIAPNEKPRLVLDKLLLYLSAGTRLVWAAYQDGRVFILWTAAGEGGVQVEKLHSSGTLDGGDVLPGFRLPVKDIFHGL
jgi:Uma2 family endonuclease